MEIELSDRSRRIAGGVWEERGPVPGKRRVCGQIIYGDAKLKSFAPFEK